MNTVAVGMSAGGFVVVMGTMFAYFSTIPRGIVPERITGLVLKLSFGMALAVAAIAYSVQVSGSAGAAVIAPSAVALMFGGFLLWLLSQRKTPVGELKVAVGDALLSFKATTSDGTGFHTDSLAGKRTLLKFFRGGW